MRSNTVHPALDSHDPSHALRADVDTSDPNMMMTLPEFVKSHPGPTHKPTSPPGSSQPGSPRLLKKPSKLSLKGRNRSNSAPPLAWLTGKTAAPRSPLVPQMPPPNGKFISFHYNAYLILWALVTVRMNVTYVAEYRENLQLVSVQLCVDGIPRSSRLEADIVPGLNQSNLVLQCGSTALSPLPLPAWVPAGKADLFTASMGQPMGATEYLDLKLVTALNEGKGEADQDLPPLLDSEQLRTCQPTSFACASCSLPVVHGLASGNIKYNDLPSDYWAELLDAWMCHPDQHVSAEIAKRADGFWPESGQVLVGGSFLLFDSSMVNRNGLVDAPTQVSQWLSPLSFIVLVSRVCSGAQFSGNLPYSLLSLSSFSPPGIHFEMDNKKAIVGLSTYGQSSLVAACRVLLAPKLSLVLGRTHAGTPCLGRRG